MSEKKTASVELTASELATLLDAVRAHERATRDAGLRTDHPIFADFGSINAKLRDCLRGAGLMPPRESNEQPFGFDGGPKPEVFIQWKGTDVCLDFTCECGFTGHFDGYFAYVLRCRGCGKEWEMPWHLYPRPSERSDGMTPREPEADGDDDPLGQKERNPE